MAQRSARRDQDNQCATPYLEYAAVIWDPVRELPYRPAAVRCRTRGRTDGSIRPRATTVLKFPLARKGASTDEVSPCPEGGVHRCCTDRGCGRNDSYPVLGSCDADVVRASQLQHAVQGLNSDVHLRRPTLVRTRAQPVPDHALEPADGGLGAGPF